MNCTPKVRQKKSNFWGSVQKKLDIMRFIMGRFASFSPEIVFLPHLSAMLQIYKSSKLTTSKP